LIPCFYVDAVVEMPYGAHPTNMPGMYYVDIDHMKNYIAAAKDPAGKDLEEYYEKYIFGVENFDEYLKKIGDKKRLKYLEDLEHLRVRE
jgi:glutaconate CoA-transferase subunit A